MANIVYELLAKIGLDDKEFQEGLNGAGEELKGWGSNAGKIATTAAKAGGAALAAAGAAVVSVGKQAIESYSEFEQLAGGIETLYTDVEGGTEAVDAMMQHANEAWKTAGLTANEYMETAIQSSAALISSLGGDVDKAAELMDLSIVDMADNVNKMGTTMEGVQNAYRGFSRGNFTMLDNLALGFAGTKEGMQELLDKAEEISGIKFNIDSFSDIVQAIHVVQDEMGIAGTTSREASETIQGSLSAMKSAWSNLITGIADGNADIGGLIDNFIESASTAAQNIIPRIEQVLQGIGQVIEGLAPSLAEAAVSLVTNVLPDLIKTAASLVSAIGNALVENLDEIIDAGVEIIFALIDGIIDALPKLIPAIIEVILTIVEKLTDPNTLMQLIEAGFQILGAVAQGLINAIPTLIKAIPKIGMNLVDALIKLGPQLIASGLELMVKLGLGIVEGGLKVVQGFVEVLGELKERILERIKEAKEWGKDLIANFINGIKEKVQALWDTVKSIGKGIKDFLGFSEPKKGPLSDFHTYAPDMMKLFAQGIKDNEHLVTDQIAKSFDFGGMTAGISAGSGGSTTNTYNITVNGIQELEELLNWYNSRQVRARMA